MYGNYFIVDFSTFIVDYKNNFVRFFIVDFRTFIVDFSTFIVLHSTSPDLSCENLLLGWKMKNFKKKGKIVFSVTTEGLFHSRNKI